MVRVQERLQTFSLSSTDMTLKEALTLRDPVSGSRSESYGLSELHHLADSQDSLLSAITNDVIFTPPSTVNSPTHSFLHRQNQSSPVDIGPFDYQTADQLHYFHDPIEYAPFDCYGTAQPFFCDLPDLTLWPHFVSMSDSDNNPATLPQADAPVPADDRDTSISYFPEQGRHLDPASQQYAYDITDPGHSWPDHAEYLTSHHEHGQPHGIYCDDSLLVPTASPATDILGSIPTAQLMQWRRLAMVDHRAAYYPDASHHLSIPNRPPHIPGTSLVNSSSSLPIASGLYHTSRLVIR